MKVRVVCPMCNSGGAHSVDRDLPYCDKCDYKVLMLPVGTTSKQMINAPGGAVYIWPELRSIEYAIRLAEKLERIDLQIFTLSDLNGWRSFAGREITGIVVDHACRLTTVQEETLRGITCCRITQELP